MSKTNCFLPSRGFCLNLRVRIVKSLMAATDGVAIEDAGRRLEPWSKSDQRKPKWLEPK